MNIDLGSYQEKNSKVFSGRDWGKKLRRDINLDKEEENHENIYVKVPEETFSINSSFFLGLFGPSVRKYKKEGFKEKFKFECKNIIMEDVEDGIERALKTSDVLG